MPAPREYSGDQWFGLDTDVPVLLPYAIRNYQEGPGSTEGSERSTC